MIRKFGYFLFSIVLITFISEIYTKQNSPKNVIFQGKKLTISNDNFDNAIGKFANNDKVKILTTNDNVKNSNLSYLGKFTSLRNLKSPSHIKHKNYYVFTDTNDFNKITEYLNDSRTE